MLELPSSGGGEIILPDEYQKVEWVGGMNGATYGPHFNTGISITQRSQMEGYELYLSASIQPPQAKTNGRTNPIVGWGSNAGLYFGCAFLGTNNFAIGFGTSTDWCFSNSDIETGETVYDYHVYWANGAGHAECNGLTCSREYIEATGSYQLMIGTDIFNAGSGHAGMFKYYGDIKLKKDGTLIHDYVPCYRKSDDKVGFYDIIAEEFKTQSGSYAFTKGADI